MTPAELAGINNTQQNDDTPFCEDERYFLARELHFLPMSEFLVAHLHFYRGLSLCNIARQRNISESKVHKLYYQALATLRRLHQKRFNRQRPYKIRTGLMSL